MSLRRAPLLAVLVHVLVASTSEVRAEAGSTAVREAPPPSAEAARGSSPRLVPAHRDRRLFPDLQIEAGGGIQLRGDLDRHYLARLRLGAILPVDPWIFGAGLTGEVGGAVELGMGAVLDAIHLESGFSLEVGMAFGRAEGALFRAGIGWSIFGVEVQHLFAPAPIDALFFKIRVPLGILAMALL